MSFKVSDSTISQIRIALTALKDGDEESAKENLTKAVEQIDKYSEKVDVYPKGNVVGKQLTSFVNYCNEEDKQKFANAVLSDHRTLQQSVFGLFLKLCEQWANLDENRYDLRNEYTVKTSKKIKEVLEDCMSTPFI